MKKILTFTAIFLIGAITTFVYLTNQNSLEKVTADVSKIWTENSPLISNEATSSSLDIFVKVAKMFKPTVVNINTTQTIKASGAFEGKNFGGDDDLFRKFFDEFFGGMPNLPKDYKQKGLGSGFIISEDGYIITNHHVIDHADEIRVKLSDTDKESFKAKVVGSDKWTDIALIKIDVPNRKLPIAPLGDSDKIEVGEWAAAIGHPFGYGHTVSQGIISAKERILGETGLSHPYNDYIQTDASINLGNSGGPLISTRGEVIGINVATDARSPGIIGFAIPINIAKDLIPQLMKYGHAIRGFIGIVYEELTEDLAAYLKLDKNQKGVVVSEVIKGDPSDLAGIKVYDVIIKFNGKTVDSGRGLLREVGRASVGKKAEVVVLREGKPLTFELKPIERKEEEEDKLETPHKKDEKRGKTSIGIDVEDVNKYPSIKEKLKVKEGVVIVGLDKDSPAEKAGLEKGDVIIEIDRKKITNSAVFNKITSEMKKGNSYLFRIKDHQRGGAPALVIIKIE